MRRRWTVGRYIDWYLVEVERGMGESVPRKELFETIQEVQDHLQEALNDNLAGGMEPREAELAAVESFGTPELFCGRVSSRSDGLVLSQPADSVAKVTGLVFLASAFWGSM